MVLFMAVPAEAWGAPTYDAIYHGFDTNFISTDRGGDGNVRVSAQSIEMVGAADSHPSVTLATTELAKFNVSLDANVVTANEASQPFRFGVWSPWTKSGRFIVFGPSPANLLTADTITNGDPRAMLLGGTIADSRPLGQYRPGETYRLTVAVDRLGGSIRMAVGSSNGTTVQSVVTNQPSIESLLGNVQLAITASSTMGAGTAETMLTNYTLMLPHQRAWASKIDDPLAYGILIALVILGLAALTMNLSRSLFVPGRALKATAELARAITSRRPIVLGVAVLVYLMGNALLFPLGGHPFDLGGEKLWAYVAKQYGTGQLYFAPSLVSLAWIWQGTPLIESAFPYGPITAYLTTIVAWLDSWLFAGGGSASLQDFRLEYLIKTINVLFGLADGALIYLIRRQIGVRGRWAVIPAGLFLFNPAVWFSMSVWGQTHVVSLFFVLAAVLLAECGQPALAWLSLGAACLTRPQMLVFALVLGIVFLRKFPWVRNLNALSWAVVALFILISPLLAVTSPSLPMDVVLHNFNIQEAGGNVNALTTVSQGGMSIWPLVTYFAHGASGLQRAFTSSSQLLVGSVSYQQVSQALTAAALLFIAIILAFKRRSSFAAGGYLPIVALAIGSFLMLLTGIVATHFLLALPFLLLIHRWIGTTAFLFSVAVWTVSTLVPMYGDMGVLISNLNYPLLSPRQNSITQFFVELHAWDRFITVAVAANVCAMAWIASTVFRPPAETRPIAA